MVKLKEYFKKNIDNIYAIWSIMSVLLAFVVDWGIIIALIILGIYLYLLIYLKFEKKLQNRTINSIAASLIIIYGLVKVYF